MKLADLIASVAVGYTLGLVADLLSTHVRDVDGQLVRVTTTDSEIAAFLRGAR